MKETDLRIKSFVGPVKILSNLIHPLRFTDEKTEAQENLLSDSRSCIELVTNHPSLLGSGAGRGKGREFPVLTQGKSWANHDKLIILC